MHPARDDQKMLSTVGRQVAVFSIGIPPVFRRAFTALTGGDKSSALVIPVELVSDTL